ncbi:MAG: L-2-amino-thiazoline-4-carboxylic acid hydrolase [Anaerolineaceae bacterium]|nr:L-2-amino-thiazoline-4-carboxylic acid hydrolase [Anaerolineaceae bacterium]
MSRTIKLAVFILGLSSGLGLTWLLRQRSKEIASLRSDWRQVLIRRHGGKKAQLLATAVGKQHAALVAETCMPENKALRWHLKEIILPGLALYRVLLQTHDGNQQAALIEVDEAFRAQTLAKWRSLLAPMKVLPAPFRLLKLVFPKIMKQFPAEGWDITYSENSDEKIIFNITRCFYLNTLTTYGAPELTASFCKCDDVMAECFPPAIRFIRPHTLGRGNELCDFQYVCNRLTPV